MIGAITNAEAISGLLALFVIVVAVLTLARIVLKREDASWRRMRFGVFVERDRSMHDRRDSSDYDWEDEPTLELPENGRANDT